MCPATAPLPTFCQQLLLLLQQQPAGLSEYQLLQQLRSQADNPLPSGELSDPLCLFRCHFLLFNGLYQLRDLLLERGQAQLLISPLCVQLAPWTPGSQALASHDPLRSYYLDLQHLEDTGSDDVERLLASFWTRLHGNEDRQAALELFELHTAEDLSLGAITRRYRQLVSQHHPDRGGSHERLQTINLAMEVLRRHYQ